MAGKNSRCPGCGYKLKRPCEFLTKFQGKSWHCGCFEQFAKSHGMTIKAKIKE